MGNDANSKDAQIEQQLKEALQAGNLKGWQAALGQWRQAHAEDVNSYIHLTGVTVDHKTLAGFEFPQVILDGCRFNQTDLTDVNFNRAHIVNGSQFEQCTFTNVAMSHCFIDHSNFSGTYQKLRIKGSVLANSCMEGEFRNNPKDPDDFNSISENPLITCTDIRVNLASGAAMNLDLAHGPLRVTHNHKQMTDPDADAQRAKKHKHAPAPDDTGIHNTSVITTDTQGWTAIQNLAHPDLKNEVLQDDCSQVRIGAAGRASDFPPPTKPTFFQKLTAGVDAEKSANNVRSDIYRAHASFGQGTIKDQSSWITGLGGEVPLISSRGGQHMVGLSLDVRNNRVNGIAVSGTDLGLAYTGISGTANETGPTFKVTGGAAYRAGYVQLPGAQVLPESAMSSFGSKFKAVTAAVSVGTWINNIGFEAGAHFTHLLNKATNLEAGDTTPNSYQVQTQVNHIGADYHATVSWKFNKDPDLMAALFLEAGIQPGTSISYDTQLSRPNGVTEVHHGLSKTGPAAYVHGGIKIGLFGKQ